MQFFFQMKLLCLAFLLLMVIVDVNAKAGPPIRPPTHASSKHGPPVKPPGFQKGPNVGQLRGKYY